MAEELRELWRFRDLLRQLVRRELKVRYKNSALGFLWSIVPPLLQVLVFTFFIGAIRTSAPNAGAYMLCGVIPWTFINTATLDSSQSLLINFPIIRKVYLPREIIPLAIVISNFIHFLLGWAVFFVFYLIVMPVLRPGGGIPLQTQMLWFPVVTAVAVMFVTGISLWAAALNVFYDDVKFILMTGFNLLLFALPVFYPADIIKYAPRVIKHPWIFDLYMLNPPAAIMEGYRKTLLQPIPRGSYNLDKVLNPPLYMNWPLFIGGSVICAFILWSGYTYFNYRKWQFVERP